MIDTIRAYFNVPCTARRWMILFFIPVAAVNIIIYYPSLLHFIRGDTFIYTATTAAYKDFYTLVLKFYSYGRVMPFKNEDQFLFRPLTYMWFGLRTWLFGYHFAWWHAAGVAFHLAAAWWLMRLLLAVRSSVLAPLATLFFSTLYAPMGLVIWEATSPYIISVIFSLAALYYALVHVKEGQTGRQRVIALTVCLTLASLTYEITVPFGPVFSCYLLMTQRHFPAQSVYQIQKSTTESGAGPKPLNRSWALLPSLSMIIYFALNYLDGLFNPFQSSVNYVFHYFEAGKTLYNWSVVVFWYLYAGIFPTLQNFSGGGRVGFNLPLDWGRLGEMLLSLNWQPLPVVAGISLIAAFAVFFMANIFRSALKDRASFVKDWSFSLLTFALLIIVSLLVILGRGNKLGLDYLKECLEYSYPFWAFLTVFLFSQGMAGWQEMLSKGVGRQTGYIAVTGLLILIPFGGKRIYETNVAQKEVFDSQRRFAEELEGFVSAHRDETDFSFDFINRPPEDSELTFMEQGPLKRYFISSALYQDYINEKTPKYLLDYHVANGGSVMNTALAAERVSAAAAKMLGIGPAELLRTANVKVITASSQMFADDTYTHAKYLMEENRTVWHAAAPPVYPQWVKVAYLAPVIINHLEMRAQDTSPAGSEQKRAPRDFVFQGSRDGSQWKNLLEVKNNLYEHGGQWKGWDVKNDDGFRHYRIFIKAGGDPNVLTIKQIRLENLRRVKHNG
ncbi:MAG: discoidin domain-containing protein [Deltaproteobacteria bacterium]|nr:discoidin domain-containing protein [Deltaproteobacteria bacterium]